MSNDNGNSSSGGDSQGTNINVPTNPEASNASKSSVEDFQRQNQALNQRLREARSQSNKMAEQIKQAPQGASSQSNAIGTPYNTVSVPSHQRSSIIDYSNFQPPTAFPELAEGTRADRTKDTLRQALFAMYIAGGTAATIWAASKVSLIIYNNFYFIFNL